MPPPVNSRGLEELIGKGGIEKASQCRWFEAGGRKMSRYTGPKCKKCRQLGFSVCGSLKCALKRREFPPGMHAHPREKMSDFGKQLLEKQKLRHTYWVSENQFRNYVKKAFSRKGKTGENLLQLLETRLDAMVYRLGFAPTILAARQMVSHGHILVNEQKTDMPSFAVKKGDVVSVREKSRQLVLLEEGAVRAKARPPLRYIEVDREKLRGGLIAMPSREEIPIPINESMVVEYYARRM